ncbi:class I SAM-dependent methyltransferase [Phytoactinopolyspora endophytica]|uniref:class I SAM-dependent methyltransferase n=1 Tax=Phytoactinopolyspora endophytica TaxID=1642495 RepID=UPI00101C9103|nr:class I SAM-dependent methyltransferase [Phytoactinopolyspora endophytica]
MRSFGAVTGRIYGWLYGRSKSNGIVVDAAELSADDRALEVGCGPGAAVALVAENIGADRVAAVDPSATFVDMVRKRVPGVDARVGSAENLPFDDGTFTVIFSLASMHHWPDRDAGLTSLTAKLAPSGRLLIAERLLKKPGHGITAEQASEVVTRLSDLGHTDVRTIQCPYGRKTMMLIHASQ